MYAYRTTARNATCETPFCLVYGLEVIIPMKIRAKSARVKVYDQAKNAEQKVDLMFLPEKRELSYAKILRYKKQVEKMYNKKVKPRTFQVGDLVFKWCEASKHVGKLDSD
ncbi:UNVERIFIED_CONTAM: hypothetical protein Slati_3792900 [Sesamum latifolium]|uniref:Uncharacterized protein n=1 Tax=Sesamum latifolium TaxID=2727402 RepID=A0AAW2U527_9LAMI